LDKQIYLQEPTYRAFLEMAEHANDYGFYQPYTDKSLNGRTGYEEEKWH